jgi:polyphosphate kinase
MDMAATDLIQPQLYINRELSWVEFNARVLDEAKDPASPLFERLKFLGIFSSNLDEFYMVRVAGLKQQIAGRVTDRGADGLLPAEQLAAINARVHALVEEQYRIWRQTLLPEIAEKGIRIVSAGQLDSEQVESSRSHFLENIFPALTPLAIDPGHPFPHLRNKSLNLALVLGKEEKRRRRRAPELTLAVVQVPSIFPRLVALPANGSQNLMLLEDLIALNAGELFPGHGVLQAAAFRVTRNWDLAIDEEESEDLRSTVEEELRRRDRGAAVRLELDHAASADLEKALATALKLEPHDVFRVDGPLQLNDLTELTKLDARPELRLEPQVPVQPRPFLDSDSIVEIIQKQDVLLHHPYESFEPVVRFIEEASEDPDVLAIKQTLYRTGVDVPIVRALSRAAQMGKQVAVLVEIKARFDEERNILWARRMEEAGVHVVYGLAGLKTHCKVALVVRREGQGIRRYVHLGTGNYNPDTARQYTDLSFFTANKEVADDVTALFNLLTGYWSTPRWKRLAVAPFDLHQRVLHLIRKETEAARQGQPARIRAKMNALVDPASIRALYEASQAGVDIELIVRGICCLRPGVPGVSERIRVISIVDRYLEHSRIFAFGPDERAEVFLSSADWMPRNFFQRIEVMFPVEDARLKRRVLDEIFATSFADQVKARVLQADGTYTRPEPAPGASRAQQTLYEIARASAEDPKGAPTRVRQVAAPAPAETRFIS